MHRKYWNSIIHLVLLLASLMCFRWLVENAIRQAMKSTINHTGVARACKAFICLLLSTADSIK